MSILRYVVWFVRFLAGLAMFSIVLLLIPPALSFLDNAESYAWVQRIEEIDRSVIGWLKSLTPTNVRGYDLARWMLMGGAFALSAILENFAGMLATKFAEKDLQRRYDAFRKSVGLSEKSKAVGSIRRKLETMQPGDAKSRDDLIRLMIETKKSLDAMAKKVAFLSIDVVGSTGMKVGEEAAFIEHDFKEYKKLVEAAMDTQGALKSAWTPDGVMICFPTVDSAIRAAQEVLVALERFNREVKTVKTQFRVRCGINAGQVHYDKATPMQEMSDRVIDVAGHMQKYASPDTIFIGRECLEEASAREGFRPAGTSVDGFEAFLWKSPSADPTQMQSDALPTPPRAEPGMTTLSPISEITNPRGAAAVPAPAAHDPLAPIDRTVRVAPAPAAAHPGMLGKYEIRRELGRGAMGIVYEGWDPVIERRVAIKTVRRDQLDSAEAEEILARFRREAKAAGRLSHPNIVAVYEFGQEGSMNFIAMEFVEGRELKDYFDKNERFPIPEVVRIMTQLLAALDAAGRNGVVHRDIKPSNIILLADGTVKVADFGIARIDSSHLTQAGSVLGTPSYMAPEQLMGQPVDRRADLFSAAVVLYQFLTSEKPFQGDRTTTIIHKVISENPPPPSVLNVTVPRSFDDLMVKALAKRPDDRFQDGLAFAEALRAAAEADKANDGAGRQEKGGDDATVVLRNP